MSLGRLPAVTPEPKRNIRRVIFSQPPNRISDRNIDWWPMVHHKNVALRPSLSGIRQGIYCFAQRFKQVGRMQEAFRMPGQHQSIGLHHGGETRKNFILRRLVKIDHDIATKNNIQRPLDRIVSVQQVDSLELYHLFQFGTDRDKTLLAPRAFQEKFT